MSEFKLTGTDALWDSMQDYTKQVRDRVLKKSLKAAGAPILTAARARAPKDTGTLQEALQMSVSSRGSKGDMAWCYVGIRRGYQLPVRIVKRGPNKGKILMAIPTRYAFQVEFGYTKRTKAGRVIGQVPPHPFMRPAWEEYGGDAALYTFADTAQAELAILAIKSAAKKLTP